MAPRPPLLARPTRSAVATGAAPLVAGAPDYPYPYPPGPTPPPPPLPPESYPVQVILYSPAGATVSEGIAVTQPDGSLELQVPINGTPVENTPVQVILYPNAGGPIVYEGSTGTVAPDGSFPINPPTP